MKAPITGWEEAMKNLCMKAREKLLTRFSCVGFDVNVSWCVLVKLVWGFLFGFGFLFFKVFGQFGFFLKSHSEVESRKLLSFMKKNFFL